MPHIIFNWIDVIFVIILIRTSCVGFAKGFLSEFFRFLGLLLAFILSFSNYTLVSQFLSEHTKWTVSKLEVIAFLLIFLGILFIFKVIAFVVYLMFHKETVYSFTRLIGLLLGFCRGVLLVSVIYMMFINSPFKYLSTSAKDRSISGYYLSEVVGKIETFTRRIR